MTLSVDIKSIKHTLRATTHFSLVNQKLNLVYYLESLTKFQDLPDYLFEIL